MNVVKILLILGLGYFALTQKSEKTKNMLLVVTGLLAFCMFSLEGFTIAASAVPTVFAGDTRSGDGASQIITAAGTSVPIYTVTGEITATADSISGITCKMAGGDSANGTIGLAATAPETGGAYTEAASISTIFTCAAVETNGQSCSAGETAGKQCPNYYKVATANCAAEPCIDTEFTATGACCEKVCPDTDCEEHAWWGFGGDGDECDDPEGLFDFTVKKCKEDS
jgi:hypothetical protein